MSDKFQFLPRVASTDNSGHEGGKQSQSSYTEDARNQDLLRDRVIRCHCRDKHTSGKCKSLSLYNQVDPLNDFTKLAKKFVSRQP